MTYLRERLRHLWSFIHARAEALAARWNGFVDFPDALPRKVYSKFSRELGVIESMLRRAIYAAALALKRPPPKSAPARTAPDFTPKTTRTEPRDPKPPQFRLSETDSLSRPFHAPRILTFDQIISIPTRTKTERPETVSTDSLSRRCYALSHAMADPEKLARKLARRLAKKKPFFLKPRRVSSRSPADLRLVSLIDFDLIQLKVQNAIAPPAPDSS
jgi:hypothetical protein